MTAARAPGRRRAAMPATSPRRRRRTPPTDPARTRSPGPIGLSCKKIRASASTKAAALRWVTATPFGVPVEPEVKMIQASSRPSGAAARHPRDEPGPRVRPASVMTPTTPASPNTRSARSCGIVGVDRDVGRAGGQRRQDRHVERVAARRHPDPDAVTPADAPRAQPFDAGLDVDDQFAVGQLHGAVVDGGRVGVARRGVVQDVDQGARLGSLGGQQVLGGNLGYCVRCHKSKILSGDGVGTVHAAAAVWCSTSHNPGRPDRLCAEGSTPTPRCRHHVDRHRSTGAVDRCEAAVEETSGVF